jgi:hypothetical protein
MVEVVYQAYGKDELLAEAVFSILSLASVTNKKDFENFFITVYTDNPRFFQVHLGKDLKIFYEELTPELINKWRGEIDFVHRVKIEILMHCINRHYKNILYLDSDTFFIESPEPLIKFIEEENFVMHLNEGKIDSKKNPIFRKMHKFLKNNQFNINGNNLKIPVETEMWNAGVLGINKKYSELLENVLSLTDQMYSKYQKHVMEQLAFSYIFQSEKKLIKSDDVIFHYWYSKTFRNLILEQLNKVKHKSFHEKVEIVPEIVKLLPKEDVKKSLLQKIFSLVSSSFK